MPTLADSDILCVAGEAPLAIERQPKASNELRPGVLTPLSANPAHGDTVTV